MEHKIIGSRWLAKIINKPERVKSGTDTDVLTKSENLSAMQIQEFKARYGNKTDFHYCPPLWDAMESCKIIDIDILLTLKASHVMFDKVHKKKTFYDIFLLSDYGARVDTKLFVQLHNFWLQKFGPVWRADFGKESEDFFNDAVSRENVHDELHKLVAKEDEPAFRKLQWPGQTTVWICPLLWSSAKYQVKINSLIEEAETLAIERNVLRGDNRHQLSYSKWIDALIDRLAPLWMVPFIVNNYSVLQKYKTTIGEIDLAERTPIGVSPNNIIQPTGVSTP